MVPPDTEEVLGYRSQALAARIATLGAFQTAWAVPSLYGNRLAVMFGRDSAPSGTRQRARLRDGRSDDAIHPLSADREAYYRFSGGDTLLTLRVGNRDIPIVRIVVTPRAAIAARTTVFDGELDLDATKSHLVRMRGYLRTVGGGRSIMGTIGGQVLEATTYVELVELEHDGAFWLPSYQRFEVQAVTPLAGESRFFVRVLTKFDDFEVEPPDSALMAGGDSLRASAHGLHVAGADTLKQYSAWRADLGALSTDARASDFDDVAPPKLRTTGDAQVRFQTERTADLVHFDRVEGLFTGLGLTASMRDRAPGLTLHASAGYAWTEQTVRGRLGADLQRGDTHIGLRVGRMLDNTNDFRSPADSGSTLGAISGLDEYDYVDRRLALLSVVRPVPHAGRLLFRFETGVVNDEAVDAHLQHGLLRVNRAFLPNRGATNGTYARNALQFELRPDLDASMARVGSSVILRYERGDGQLDYQRAELRLMDRVNRGRWTFAARFDAGALLGPSAVPQQLFEIGRGEGLQAYDYKEFVGDRAAIARGIVMRRLPFLESPIHLIGLLWLPEPSPALAVNIQSGWSALTSDAARAAVVGLGTAVPPLPTGNPRTTVGAGIRFFGGSIGLMLVRAVDHADRWKLRLDFRPQP